MKDLNSKYKVHIVIPTKNCIELVKQTISSITDKQLYNTDSFTNFDIYIADTGSDDDVKEEILQYQSRLTGIRFHNIYINGYHYAKVNNYVIKNSLRCEEGVRDLVLLCNNDLKLLTDCITEFVEFYDTHTDVGTVGCKLLFGNRTIQHAGQHIVRAGSDDFFPTHRGLKQEYTNYSDVEKIIGNTAALAMIDLELFLDIGGLNENYEFGFEDLQLNLDCIAKGKDNYYLGSSMSYHLESINKEREGFNKMRQAELSRKDYTEVFKPYILNNREFFDKTLNEFSEHHKQWTADESVQPKVSIV